MSEHPAVAKLKERFGERVLEVAEHRGQVAVTVDRDAVIDICSFLKQECGYRFLTDVCGVDYLGRQPRFMVVYQLCNMDEKRRLRLKAPVPEEDCRIASVTGIWSTANWLEREVWDMFGIEFKGHPDLRRILLPDDWEGHPLRKDYPVQGPDREPYQGRLS